MQFSSEQQKAYDLYLEGHNVFLTGPGGTGKSKWIQTVAKSKSRIQVCAMTGCAAILLECNAKTVHSWAGIGLGDASKALKNKFARSRWLTTDVLIIDEISMMSASLFELLDSLGKSIRRSTKPFGGIQLLFCGDFYQLPPVDAKFCFESPLWKGTFQHTVQLSILFRQKNEVYQSILHEIRSGKISKKSHLLLKERLIDGDGSTKLVPTRAQADAINTKEYHDLSGEEAVFTMKCSTTNQYDSDYLKKNVRCDETIRLKVGTKVMCIVNIDESLCNGSQGEVVRIDDFPIVRFSHGEVAIRPHVWSSDHSSITQIPLIYAWAITIHKAQGATLQSAEINLGNDVFECGQTYVALSRLVDIKGLFLTSFNIHKIKLHPKVVEFYNSLEKI
jgi:ATP-dependent DNA helicase PIF1